jgi:hypothetical protein
MGGWGSGRSYSSKATTSGYRALDVRLLQRQGWLDVCIPVSITWSRRKRPEGNITIRARRESVTLSYRYQRPREEWQSKEYSVDLERTACHYGGERVWFRCPVRGCGRRVAILYGGVIFACRSCHALAYDSQSESRSEASDRRAWAIREKCGGWGCLFDPVFKPKGMHNRTFRQLEEEYRCITRVTLMKFADRVGMSFADAENLI